MLGLFASDMMDNGRCENKGYSMEDRMGKRVKMECNAKQKREMWTTTWLTFAAALRGMTF